MKQRIERDSMGEILVSEDKFWGAQTQRSLENFVIGTEKMPFEIIYALASLKKAAALANCELGNLEAGLADVIAMACDEVLSGKWDDQFPLAVWQTGSGTQSNMNMNEVVAHLANNMIGESRVHPNDDVNKAQSSNDIFPTAMHVSAVIAIENHLLPEVRTLQDTFSQLSQSYKDIVKIGRTHLQDATPLTLGQEISAWSAMLQKSAAMIETGLGPLRELAIGGTAVGTGINAPEGFGDLAAKKISQLTGTDFVSSDNKFHALTSKDALVSCHGALKALACDLMKICNDVRWLASGPRCGIGEISIPENEPGSSIMPGKVNPTQCEALTMVCCQVMGNDVTVGFAASQGNFQLNVYMPVIIYNFLQSVRLLADGIRSFNKNCAVGIKPVETKIEANLNASLMLVTALNPRIGYDNAAKAAKKAFLENITLREAVVELALLTPDEFDEIADPKKMI